MTQHVKHLVAAHWNRRAAEFDEGLTHGLLNPAQGAAWRAVLRDLASPALDVLDVGCGTGFLALLLAEAGHRAVGMDLADEMLDLARVKARARDLDVAFLHADAETPPFAPGSFDLVVGRHIIWTLPDPVGALRAWRALLRPGGRAALVEGAWWDMAPRAEYADIAADLPLFGGRPAAELAPLLREAGFAEPAVSPLTRAELWVDPTPYERYLLVAARS